MSVFDWDAGNRDKCRKHGLTEAEIEYALTHGARVSPDPAHSMAEQRFIAASRNAAGRAVFVAFCWRGNRLRPISARYMHAREAARHDLETPNRSGDDDG
jgi:uncharacterized DUF497 family protein